MLLSLLLPEMSSQSSRSSLQSSMPFTAATCTGHNRPVLPSSLSRPGEEGERTGCHSRSCWLLGKRLPSAHHSRRKGQKGTHAGKELDTCGGWGPVKACCLSLRRSTDPAELTQPPPHAPSAQHGGRSERANPTVSNPHPAALPSSNNSGDTSPRPVRCHKTAHSPLLPSSLQPGGGTWRGQKKHADQLSLRIRAPNNGKRTAPPAPTIHPHNCKQL